MHATRWHVGSAQLCRALPGIGRASCADAAYDWSTDAVRVGIAIVHESPGGALTRREERGCRARDFTRSEGVSAGIVHRVLVAQSVYFLWSTMQSTTDTLVPAISGIPGSKVGTH